MAKRQKTCPDFLKASGKGIGLPEQFTPDQLLWLHRLHAHLQSEGALSDLSFEYRHHICRASFNLIAGYEGAPVISVRLTEEHIREGQWLYKIDTVVDEIIPQPNSFMTTMSERELSEPLMAMIVARVKAENAKILQCDSGQVAAELKSALARMTQRPT